MPRLRSEALVGIAGYYQNSRWVAQFIAHFETVESLHYIMFSVENALCPIDASGGQVFVKGEYWSATSDTFVKKENPYKS
jgi:membrane-bound ClpP family serine protease